MLVQVASLFDESEEDLNASRDSMSGFKRAWRSEKWKSKRERAKCGFTIVVELLPLQLEREREREKGGNGAFGGTEKERESSVRGKV